MPNQLRIKALKENVSYLEHARDSIVHRWTSNLEVCEILLKHDVEIEFFNTNYAHPVLNYFIGVINATQEIGNCPVISKLLEYLSEKNITASELFMICINFRKAIIKEMFDNEVMQAELYDSISYVFDANFRGVLEAFNDTISEAKKETKRLYELSIRDHLTGIYNRKMFDEILSLEIKNAVRNKTDFSLIIFDIDHFKNINDNFGHEIGDKVLIKLSLLVQGTLRDSDILARWGGEEFIILMPKANIENSKKKAEKIRKVIESYEFDAVNHITCSFGVTQYRDGDDSSSLFNGADEALYLSKSNGRNIVSIY